jgi:tetratricopeptide (TPR) repeat protein
VRRPFAALALSALALMSPTLPASAQQEPQKVLESASSGLNLSAVQAKVAQGDAAAAAGKLSQAKADYDQALEAATYLVSAYRNLSGAFRGLDARIPREMDQKGREATELQANIELRLAALLRRMNQPQVAVPLLVRVVQRMSPTSPQGQKAYQSLLELGFVVTPYTAASAAPAAQ